MELYDQYDALMLAEHISAELRRMECPVSAGLLTSIISRYIGEQAMLAAAAEMEFSNK